MLSKNIQTLRQAKGLTQNELAIKLNVVRQTVSKWERGLSVPDAQLLIDLADALDTSVPVLLGESVTIPKADDLSTISAQLALINDQLAKRQRTKKRVINGLTIGFVVLIIVIALILINAQSDYLSWDYHDPTTAVLGVGFPTIEWVFFRVSPFIVIGLIIFLIFYNRRH